MIHPTPVALVHPLGEKIIGALAMFTGTESYRRHALRRSMVMTDGVVWLAEKAGAYWLTDVVASYQGRTRALVGQDFQVWTLHVRQGDKPLTYTNRQGKKAYASSHAQAVVVCSDGDGQTLVTQAIPYTDFPLSSITLYLEKGSVDGETVAWILMLPGER